MPIVGPDFASRSAGGDLWISWGVTRRPSRWIADSPDWATPRQWRCKNCGKKSGLLELLWEVLSTSLADSGRTS